MRRVPVLGEYFAQALFHVGTEAFEPLVKARLHQGQQGGDACGHGQRIARERAGLVTPGTGAHLVHDVGAAAKGADRQPASDDFAEGAQVGCDAVMRLGTP